MTEKKYPYIPFRPTAEVDEIIQDIPYGHRSKFINNCVTCHAQEIGIKLKQETDFPRNLQGSENSSEQKTTSFEPTTQYKEQAASAKQPTTKSKPNTQKRSLLSSLLGEP